MSILMSKTNPLNKNKRILSDVFVGIGLFLLFFALMFMLRNRMHFNSDEYDNFLGGMVVANGGEIYRDFSSQHTPMLYYLCALFYLLGARTVVVYRLMTYAFLSLVWVAMYFRYNKTFGKVAMFLYPMLYITIMFTADNVSHSILSEQIQAQALSVLLLEFLQYKRLKSLKFSNYLCISLSVLFSFGTAFVSIYPIFVIGMGVFINEVICLVKTKHTDKAQLGDEVKKFFIHGIILAAFCIFPFAVIGVIYIAKGNVQNAIYGIYIVNREFYPKYGGASSSILMSFLNPVFIFRDTMKDSGMFFVNISVIGAAVVSVVLMYKKKVLKGLVCLAFIYMCAMRAMTGFHGLPFLGVGMCFFALAIQYVFTLAEKDGDIAKLSKPKLRLVSAVMVVIVLIPSLLTFARAVYNKEMVVSKDEFTYKVGKGTLEDIIVTLTDEDDRIYDGTITLLYISAQRLPVKAPAVVCPWIYDAYHDKIIESLDEEKPKFIYLPDEFEVWGYKSEDFAADAYEWIRSRYTSFESVCGINGVYIINDYYDEAVEKWVAHVNAS